jgi:hypothetical protein
MDSPAIDSTRETVTQRRKQERRREEEEEEVQSAS